MATSEMEHKLFTQIRLHPWIPEHLHWINRQISMLRFEGDTTAADSFQKEYDAKLEKYYVENPTERPVEEKKKVGRPAKVEETKEESIPVPPKT